MNEEQLETGEPSQEVQNDPPAWATAITERLEQQQQLIESLTGQLSQKPQHDPNVEYIPGTDIPVPPNWDDMDWNQQQAYSNAKIREQIVSQVNQQVSPMATAHLMSTVTNGLTDEEIQAAHAILAEAQKADPNFAFNQGNAQALRLMARGAVLEQQATQRAKDGVTTAAQEQVSDLAAKKQWAIETFGEKVGGAFTDDELREIVHVRN